MGRDKGALRMGGESLLARQARVLAQAGVGERIVSLRPGQPHPDPSVELPVVRDAESDRGPLEGIVAGLARVAPRALVVLAVDMPGVTPRELRPLVAWEDPECSVAYRVGGRWEPLCARYAPDVLADARSRLSRGRLAPTDLLDDLARQERLHAIDLPAGEGAAFRSWNRPGDVVGG
jgi:molybdenum cofactor guanylyltransferase